MPSRFKAPSGGQSSDSVNALIVALDLLIKRTKALQRQSALTRVVFVPEVADSFFAGSRASSYEISQ